MKEPASDHADEFRALPPSGADPFGDAWTHEPLWTPSGMDEESANEGLRVFRWLEETLALERDSWFCWLPGGLGLGICLYFSLTFEPPMWLMSVMLALSILASTRLRLSSSLTTLLVRGLVAAVVGVVVAQSWAHGVSSTQLERDVGPASFSGRVRSIAPLESGYRLIVDKATIDGLDPSDVPEKIRLRIYERSVPINGPPLPGVRVSGTVKLSPPREPVLPDGYDMQRQLWFSGIGATGFVMGSLLVTQPDEGDAAGRSVREAASIKVQAFRSQITQRLLTAGKSTGNEEAGALAAALLTGDRTAVPETIQEAYRAAGIAHLLSISGLHMSMIGGMLFVVLRAVMAMCPFLAEKTSIKKIAALLAIMGAGFYLLISGANVPAQRAFIMFGLILLGVLLDRRAFSRRTICIAAIAVLMVSPETLLGASFQMSFAAVLAMIVAYEAWGDNIAAFRSRGRYPALRTVWVYVLSLAFTTVIATVATTPYGAHHFGTVYIYGLIGNTVAVPLTGFWVMPMGLIALLLMPFGLEEPAILAMGWGLDVINATALAVLEWPHAILHVPSGPGWAVGLMSFGGLWLCLRKQRWRWFGLVPIAIGFAVPFSLKPPDILISPSGSLIAVQSTDAGGSQVWLFNDLRKDRFARQVWLEKFGGEVGRFPKGGLHPSGQLRCDSQGCKLTRQGLDIALPFGLNAAMEDRAQVDVMIAPNLHGLSHNGQSPLVITAEDIQRNGAYAIWIASDGEITVRTGRSERGQRPWTAY